MVRDSMKPGTPESKLLAKPIKVNKNGTLVTVFSAVNAGKSERGMYLKLKEAYEQHPEVREHVHSIMSYKKLLKAEQKSGGPIFNQPERAST